MKESNIIASVVSPVLTGTFSVGQLVIMSAIVHLDAQRSSANYARCVNDRLGHSFRIARLNTIAQFLDASLFSAMLSISTP